MGESIRNLILLRAVKRVQPEGTGDFRDHHALYLTLLTVNTAARLDSEARRQRVAIFKRHGRTAGLRGLEGTPSDYLVWVHRRQSYRTAWRALFRDWDVVLSPAINVLAYPHVERAWPPDDSDYTLTFDVNGRKAPYNDGIVYPAIATMPGRPATTFPVGRSREGLPIGLQAIDPYLEDFTPIRFAALLAKEIGGFVSPDGF